MKSFDWDGLNKLLTRPSSALVGRLVRRITGLAVRAHWVSALPREEAELTAYLKKLLPSEDWYAGKTPAEAGAIDRIADDLIELARHAGQPDRRELLPRQGHTDKPGGSGMARVGNGLGRESGNSSAAHVASDDGRQGEG